MTKQPRNALDIVASPPPPLSAARALGLLDEYYGLTGTVRRLISERDLNYRLDTPDGRRFVLKIANAAEDPLITDFQVQALLHIESRAAASRCGPATPRLVRTLTGEPRIRVTGETATHVARLVSYVDGIPLGEQARSDALCRDMGRNLAQLGHWLRDFTHPGQDQALIWDVKRAPQLRALLPVIDDARLRGCAQKALQAYERSVQPVLGDLRWQVIHHDFHPDNVLLHKGDANRVAGVIDFGDMLYSPLVADIGVATSYLRAAGDDPLQQVLQFLAGYCDVEPLADKEARLLPDLIRLRLAASICIMRWRAEKTGGNDPYLDEFGAGVETAGRFLLTLDGCDTRGLQERMVEACCR